MLFILLKMIFSHSLIMHQTFIFDLLKLVFVTVQDAAAKVSLELTFGVCYLMLS